MPGWDLQRYFKTLMLPVKSLSTISFKSIFINPTFSRLWLSSLQTDNGSELFQSVSNHGFCIECWHVNRFCFGIVTYIRCIFFILVSLQ